MPWLKELHEKEILYEGRGRVGKSAESDAGETTKKRNKDLIPQGDRYSSTAQGGGKKTRKDTQKRKKRTFQRGIRMSTKKGIKEEERRGVGSRQTSKEGNSKKKT